MSIRLGPTRSDGKSGNHLTWFAVAVFLVTLSPYFLPILSADAMVDYGDMWADIPFIGLIVFLIFFRRPPAASGRERGFWAMLGAGFAFWLVGRVAWALLYDLGLPVDLASDFLYLILYVGILVALELDPGRRSPTDFGRRMRRYTVGGGIVLLVSGYVYFAVVPALLSPESYESWKPGVVGTVIFDCYVTIQLLIRIRSTDSDHWRRVYGWMATAFGAWVVTVLLDLISLYATIAWLNPGTLLDLLWYLPYALFVVSLLVGRQPHEDVTAPARSAPGLMSDSPLIAYAGTLMAIHILLDVTGMFDSRLHVARGVLVVLETLILGIIIFKAQRLVMRESRRLHRGFEEVSSDLERANRGLEERVRQRTAEIVATNRQLREAEARNLALIRAVPDALVLVDRAGVVREVYPSRDSTDVLDLTSFRGRLLGDELPAEYRADIDQAMNRIRDGAGQQTLAMTVANSSGSRHFELRGGQCGNDEILVLIQDVTERQDFESSLQQSQRLESLGIMAGGIAHDFNNLLVSILGNAQLALESLPAGADVPRTLAAIESGAIRAAKLTSNLLAYAGEAHIERETLDLVRVFAEMDTLLATAVPKRTRFRFDCGNEPLWIDANEAQVTQILLNLVRNAAEALPGGDGDIEVSLQRCRIDDAGLVGQVLGETLLPGDHVRLQVRDSGYGMDAEIQQRIFDPFFTSKGTGRGLGLAAVLGIVNHHRAALTLDSRPDEGTTFSVYFPARVAPTTAPATSATSTAIRSTGTILVVDDEEGVRDLITAYLETLGLSTVVAVNGQQAVEMAQSHRGRLTAILMDYAMPEMNGVEAYHIIRRGDPDVPVIMLSGYGERRALGPLADDDQTEFLQKPFRLNDLAAALREPLGLSG